MSALAQVGVRPEYRHTSKLVRPEANLTLGVTVLKWYDIAPADNPVPLAIRALARRNLRDGAKLGELTLDDELGFVVLHRCGESFYFLLVTTWRNDNELWETVWAKTGDRAFRFEPWPIGRGHRPTFCVWELGVVCHEQQAWARYLRSPRDELAKQAYLGDSMAGEV
jgi:hypothetical protein